MKNEVDSISEAIGRQGAQIDALKETVITNHVSFEKKVDSVLSNVVSINDLAQIANSRINIIEPYVYDYVKLKRNVVSCSIRVAIFASVIGISAITSARAEDIFMIIKTMSGG